MIRKEIQAIKNKLEKYGMIAYNHFDREEYILAYKKVKLYYHSRLGFIRLFFDDCKISLSGDEHDYLLGLKSHIISLVEKEKETLSAINFKRLQEFLKNDN